MRAGEVAGAMCATLCGVLIVFAAFAWFAILPTIGLLYWMGRLH